MTYQWKPASHTKTDANIAGAVMEQLASNGKLSAENLLEVSRPVEAPLHAEFEWCDEKAAEMYRLDQARYLIRNITVAPNESSTETVRAFFTIEAPTYKPLSVIISKSDERDKLLAIALRELKSFQMKYSALSELNPVFDAAERLQDGETA